MDPQEIAQYLADNGLSIDDVDSILSDDDAAAVRAEMQAIDYVPPDEADATDLKDMLAAGASESIDAYVDANGVDDLKTLASGGFKDEDSAQAYYLAEALDTAEPEARPRPRGAAHRRRRRRRADRGRSEVGRGRPPTRAICTACIKVSRNRCARAARTAATRAMLGDQGSGEGQSPVLGHQAKS